MANRRGAACRALRAHLGESRRGAVSDPPVDEPIHEGHENARNANPEQPLIGVEVIAAQQGVLGMIILFPDRSIHEIIGSIHAACRGQWYSMERWFGVNADTKR